MGKKEREMTLKFNKRLDDIKRINKGECVSYKQLNCKLCEYKEECKINK
jgi:CRISPR/Cas system-associated exonuclease Cas4 (RecB family)